MKVLVTGGLGHIGSKLVEYLSNEGHSITVVDNISTQRYSSIFNRIPKIFSFYPIDTRDEKIEKFVDENDVVIHLAGMTDAAGSINMANELFENNLKSTINISRMTNKYNKKLVFSSSTSVYGYQENIVSEITKELNPMTPYAKCKIDEENFIQNNNSNFSILRLGTIFGVSNGMRFHTAVNKFCWDSAFYKKIVIWQDAFNQVRPYLGLGDACVSILRVIDNEKNKNEIINILTLHATPENIATEIKARISDLEIMFENHSHVNQTSYEVSNKKALNSGFVFRDQLSLEIDKTLKLLIGDA